MSTTRIAVLCCLLFTAVPMIVAIDPYNASIKQFTYTNSTTTSATQTPQNFSRGASETISFSETTTAKPFLVFDNFTIFVLGLVAAIGIPVVIPVYQAARKSGRAFGPSLLASFVALVAVVCLVIIVAGPMSQIIIPSIRSLPTASVEVSVVAVGLIIICGVFLVWFFRRPLLKVSSSKPPTQKPLGVKLFDCNHYRKENQSILEMDFELNNPGDHPTSLRELKAWILDGTMRLDADLQVLWDYRTLAKISEPYDPQRAPPFEKLHLPHPLGAHTTERYVAFFVVRDVVITGESAKCGLVVKHTHGKEKREGVSQPSPLQKVAGGLAQDKYQHRQPHVLHGDELLVLLRKLLIRWQQYMELSDRVSEFAYRENMKSFAIGLSDQLLELDSTHADSWDFGLRNQVQIVSKELRQFGLGLEEPPLPELLEAAEKHGLLAYETARALVSFLEPKKQTQSQ